MRYAAGHDRHEFATRGSRKERTNRERRLGLPHEDGCGYVHAFGAGDAHRLEHYPGERANDDLHQANVVENGKERRDEDDGGQHLKGEDGAERCVWRAEFAEQDRRTSRCGAQHLGDNAACPIHCPLAEVEAKHKERK